MLTDKVPGTAPARRKLMIQVEPASSSAMGTKRIQEGLARAERVGTPCRGADVQLLKEPTSGNWAKWACRDSMPSPIDADMPAFWRCGAAHGDCHVQGAPFKSLFIRYQAYRFDARDLGRVPAAQRASGGQAPQNGC